LPTAHSGPYVEEAAAEHVSVPETPHDLCSVEIVVVHDAAFPYVPALHVQAARAELEIGELELAGHATQVAAAVAPVVVKYVPAAQSVHTALPVVVLYLPVVQAVHVPPSGPVDPALHVQAVITMLVLGELELVGHVVHAALRMKTLAPLRRFKIAELPLEFAIYNILLLVDAVS
jgi:hypothetical protein